MSKRPVYFVGTPSEVEHHAAPLMDRMALQIVAPEHVVEIAKPGDLAIFFSEHFDRFRSACQILKQQDVATVYLVDGILEWRNSWENSPDEPACPYAMRPVLSHKAACIGPSQARVLESWGNQGKTEVVGIPRLDGLKSCRTRRLESDEFHLLVMTAKTPGFSDHQIQLTKSALFDLKNRLAALSGASPGDRPIRVTWRLTAGLDQEIGVDNQLTDLSGVELAATLQTVDAVISTPSTAMLEAMLLDLPVAALDYHNCPAYLPTAWNIRNPESIDFVIRELSNPPESKMLFQQGSLHEALQHDTAATDRLETLIVAMQEITKQQLGKQRLQFPTQILDATHTNSGLPFSFDHASVYPGVHEFSKEDLNELQVELSHARREIRHLQREKAQIQAELSEAHEIFAEIHRHPIAGPVVRVRQRILDWFEGRRGRREGRDSELGRPTPATSPGHKS